MTGISLNHSKYITGTPFSNNSQKEMEAMLSIFGRFAGPFFENTAVAKNNTAQWIIRRMKEEVFPEQPHLVSK
jgi:hypothetical protein